MVFCIFFSSLLPFAAASKSNSESIPENNISFHKPTYITIDPYLSPIVGADLMILGLRGYQALDDTLLPNTECDTYFPMVLGRTAKFLFEGTFSMFLMVSQHEVFGHGYRSRVVHVPVTGYKIEPFSGVTFIDDEMSFKSINEQTALIAGGMEATGILSKRIRTEWLESHNIDSREASLYLASSLMDQPQYILRAPKFEIEQENELDGHDVNSYVKAVNYWYGERVLSQSNLKMKALIDFLDPYLFYSLYSIGNYIIEGSQTFCHYPMFTIGDYQYLPSFRLSLAPFGPEYQMFNHIRSPENMIIATLRYGNTAGRRSYGITYETFHYWQPDQCALDFRVDLWQQPKLFTPFITDTNEFGAALSLLCRYQVFERLQLMGQLGYKTKGFIPGESLKQGVIARIGLVMKL